MKFQSPFYHLVPKDYEGNLRWRALLHRKVLEEPAFADVLYEACAQDILFYVNSFVWTFDTRTEPFSKLPFITYPRQDECLQWIVECMGKRDGRLEKSRDTGASWMCIVAFEHCWHFDKTARHMLMVSRNEEYVDKKDNPKSLFWKFDYLLDNLPDWLRPPGYDPDLHRTKNHATNPYTGSKLDGEATTPNIARGDRRWAIFIDEFSQFRKSRSVMMATQRATNSRIFNSTPFGIGNAFYDTKQMPMANFTFHWKDDPRKSVGLYTSEDGKLKVLDKAGYPKDYTPILDGKLRSIAYDEDERRATSQREMAQEWDINYLGSGGQFFNAANLIKVRRMYARPPLFTGTLEYDAVIGDPQKFQESPDGRLNIWCPLVGTHKPNQEEDYVIGIDISAGTGASNSTLSVWNKRTCEKVASYANPYIEPEAFATLAVAVAKWFNNAQMIWEMLGVGSSFGKKVIDLGYRHIYWRRKEEAIDRKVSNIPGWHPGGDRKLNILTAYKDALEKGNAINHDADALRECDEYIYSQTGNPVHAKSTDVEDPSGAGANHGDRVIADALGWKLVNDRRPKISGKKPKPKAMPGSLAWRMQEVEKRINKNKGRELPVGW